MLPVAPIFTLLLQTDSYVSWFLDWLWKHPVYIVPFIAILSAIGSWLNSLYEKYKERSRWSPIQTTLPPPQPAQEKPKKTTPPANKDAKDIKESKETKPTDGTLDPKPAQKPSASSDVTPPPVKSKPAAKQKATKSIFISYRRQDSNDVTGRIYDRLIAKFGKQAVFKDVDSIPLGVDFREVLSQSVGQCAVLLAVIGKQWLTVEADGGQRRLEDSADFVRIEIEAALQRNIPVIPLLVQQAAMPREDLLPESLKKLAYRNAIHIRPDPDFHPDMDRLIKGIELHLNS
ncbi:MAG: TIR domain-containing protein [Acidobacteriota bacterium]